MKKSVYMQVKEKALPLMEAYTDDVVVHDRKWLRENPGTPFLHFTGKTGTYLVGLIAANKYPKGSVPYIFGTATREEILEEEMSVVGGMENRYGRGDMAMHYDGKFLKEITYQKATMIADDYVEETRRAWRKS